MNLDVKLSKREMEVAEIMAFTKNKSDAAHRLCISEGTLSAHTFRIYEKLNINSKSELVIWWMVTKEHISKKAIPYFKMIPILIISYGLVKENNIISRRLPRRFETERSFITSK